MMYLLLYLVIGLVATVLTAIDEVVTAKTNQLDVEEYLDWFSEPTIDIFETNTGWAVFAFIFGWLLWPVRVLQAITERTHRFESYIAEKEEEES